MDEVLFSSESTEWETPQDLFNELDKEFHFTLDPCATELNAKCKRFFSWVDDGLSQSWDGERVFMNPPYGREVGSWVRKAAVSKALVVCLLPARTDTRWFHDYVYHRAEIRFLRGRLRFVGASNAAPFPSMIVIFNNSGEK